MSPPNFDLLCQQARQAISERNWEKARQAYLQALGLKSDSADIHQGLATVCFQLHDLNSAAHHFREVTRLDPLRAGAYINLGAVCNLLDQLDEAVTSLRRGIQLDPQRAEGYYNLGLVYRRKGQVDLAIHAYREALRLNARMPDAHYNLANVYLDKEDYRRAVQHYQQALVLRPGWEKARQGLSVAESALQESQAATSNEGAGSETPTVPDPAAQVPTPKLDPQRVLDPDQHTGLLTPLHKATVEAEELSKQLLQMVTDSIEPVIKELSSCLINPDSSITQLDACIKKFEEAMSQLRGTRDSLKSSVNRVRTHGEKLVAEATV
jgi:Flp pilus assembly protein TadD